MVNVAGGLFGGPVALDGKMGAPLLSGLEDHGIWIIRRDGAVRLDGSRIDDENIQMVAALATASAYHCRTDAQASILISITILDLLLGFAKNGHDPLAGIMPKALKTRRVIGQ